MGEQRDTYLEKFKTKLDEWNLEINQLQAQAKGTHGFDLVSFNKQIESLQGKRDELKGKMVDLHTRGEAAWIDLKDGFGTAWKELGDSIDHPKSKL
jgi:hypothetical protein